MERRTLWKSEGREESLPPHACLPTLSPGVWGGGRRPSLEGGRGSERERRRRQWRGEEERKEMTQKRGKLNVEREERHIYYYNQMTHVSLSGRE